MVYRSFADDYLVRCLRVYFYALHFSLYAPRNVASHGATTGQLDESALFYMQQRCIDRDTAAKLLLCAFFNEVIETLTDTQLQEELVEKINRIL